PCELPRLPERLLAIGDAALYRRGQVLSRLALAGGRLVEVRGEALLCALEGADVVALSCERGGRLGDARLPSRLRVREALAAHRLDLARLEPERVQRVL